MEVIMESTYELESTEETLLPENDNSDESELEDVPETESDSESIEEDSVSVSENTVETEVDSDEYEEESVTDEYALYSDVISETDAEAIVLAINQQTEVVQKGDAAICAGLGLLVGILFIQGFRLRRV